MFVETRDVLGLLDELEAKDSMIAAQQHEIRTLLNALEGRPCPKCNDTGMADSGGTQPWGEPISVPCDCAAPPSPVAVPAAMEMDDDFDSSFEHGKAVGWNAYRAAMLQGADGTLTNEGTIPVTQFKPVADLYGLTSPTGGETSFTFDAVEARDFIDGGWSCQEYVELERFQEAVSGNSPVIPDGWVVVPVEPTEEMNKAGWTAMNEHDAINPTYRAMLAAAPQQED
ncbi:ead/Ea22-like family protein [Enterobacter roggenkampii]|uniref:ead/Ea22-like family protein n=1 Tax=Enterobacter roggenkampii TaxID=1812935 RepID=UPI0035AB9D4E